MVELFLVINRTWCESTMGCLKSRRNQRGVAVAGDRPGPMSVLPNAGPTANGKASVTLEGRTAVGFLCKTGWFRMQKRVGS